MLCRCCEEIFQGEAGLKRGREVYWSEWRDHHKTLRDLQVCAKRDCFICIILFERLSDDIQNSSSGLLEEKSISTYSLEKSSSAFYVHFSIQEMARQYSSLVSFNLVGGNSFVLVDKEMISEKTSSSKCLSLIRKWLTACQNDHSICKLFEAKPVWYPKRLLRLDQGKDEPVLRLVETEKESVSGSYVSLSHCWGGVEILKLTRATLNQFCLGLQESELPRTFRDAIDVTRQLGFQYLWIDSLCIVQDSMEDWRTESAAMLDVYSHAVFNIAALAARNPHDGFFVTRRPQSLIAPTVITNWTDLPPAVCGIEVCEVWDGQCRQATLITRGWVVQERLLSTRNLHFGRSQICWECHELEASGTYPSGLQIATRIELDFQQAPIPRKRAFPSLAILQQRRSLENNERDLIVIRGYWNEIILCYTGTQLTRETDKLPALSGLAKMFHHLKGSDDEYLAGMWRSTMKWDLCWCVGATEMWTPLTTPQIEYRAPSWSWASLDGSIRPCGAPVPSPSAGLFKILDAQVTPLLSNDVTGGLTGGFLRVSGSLHGLYVLCTDFSILSALVWCVSPATGEPIVVKRGEGCCQLDTCSPEYQAGVQSFMYLPLHFSCREDDVDRPKIILCGILLEPVSTSYGTYIRRGYIELSSHRQTKQDRQRFRDNSSFLEHELENIGGPDTMAQPVSETGRRDSQKDDSAGSPGCQCSEYESDDEEMDLDDEEADMDYEDADPDYEDADLEDDEEADLDDGEADLDDDEADLDYDEADLDDEETDSEEPRFIIDGKKRDWVDNPVREFSRLIFDPTIPCESFDPKTGYVITII